MTITLETVQALAPDQASLKAAQKLLSEKKWPVKERTKKLIWGNCQGSGANPYLAVFDLENHGYKCSCPSRKFPCKHILALTWIFSNDESNFIEATEPQWILDWQGRRRKPSTTKSSESKESSEKTTAQAKDIHATLQEEPTAPIDPKKQAAAEKRAAKVRAATDAAISASLIEWQQWLNDQLRLGLNQFIEQGEARCRQIAARLVDGKASSFASRLDELPARWAGLRQEWRLRYAISELGKMTFLARMWQKNPTHLDVRRAITNAETRANVIENPDAPRQKGFWQVIAEQTETRRDNMISHATWLRSLDEKAPYPFALLLDFFPRSIGSREPVRLVGEILHAEVIFYPSVAPLRGFIEEQKVISPEDAPHVPNAPATEAATFFKIYQEQLLQVPWLLEMPFLLPEGKIIRDKLGQDWWQAKQGNWHLPITLPEKETKSQVDLRCASELEETFILWNGVMATFGSAKTKDWGII